ncbi:Fic family protein [Rhabdochlamydiaceae symbiont of Dictyostelium giganteum]|uniref:Fic family protein n=1 Tax=Rhabdochlamydiaceae symbiont of Dictyostelium giganteum TaxID=3342349 RepID=UPI00384B8700
MHSLEEGFLKSLTFTSEQLTTLRTLGEYRGKQALYFQQAPEVLKGLQELSIIESSESSNRLEGITAPARRITELVKYNSTPKDRSEQEIAGYRDALNLIHQSANHMPFSTSVILQLHAWIYRYLSSPGGEWKTTDNEIIERLPDGGKRVRFIPSNAFETPLAMESLIQRYQLAIQERCMEPLIVIPAVILDFLCIHPFRDGNGRVARLLTLLLLYHTDYQVGKYISLERIFEESKESYYETLEKSSHGWHQGRHDLMPWMTYFWGVLVRAYKEFEGRVSPLKQGKGNKTDHVSITIKSIPHPFSISDIERACPSVSRDLIRLVLRQLRDEGTIISEGKGRSAKWVKRFT